jgi:hypothetical protein
VRPEAAARVLFSGIRAQMGLNGKGCVNDA